VTDTTDKCLALASKLSESGEFCFDTETTAVDPVLAKLVGLSFCFKDHEAWFVPISEHESEAQERLEIFRSVFGNPLIQKIGQNIKYDIIVLMNYGIQVRGPLFDTMIAHYLLQPDQRHNMDYLAETFLQYQPVSIETLIGKKGAGQRSMRDAWKEQPEKVAEYAAEDADVTWQLKRILHRELEKQGLMELATGIEMPLIPVLAAMEKTGVSLHVEDLHNYAIELNRLAIETEKEIFQLAGYDFNIASPKQLGEILFDRLKIDPQAKKTKTGQYATNEETLARLSDRHPLIGKILDYRGLKKLISTYVEALPRLINPETGKIHTSYNQAVAATGRLSSVNPNLQNIPIRDEQGREIRKAFIPSGQDFLFFSADYSQIELRLMAHLSQDPGLCEAFRRNEDIHAATAAKIFKVPLSEVTRDMRSKAKTANFGIIYGISSFGLSQRLNIPKSEGKSLIDGYFENYPRVKQYMDECIRLAREKGFVETIFGRQRQLPDINSRNAVVRGMAERNAINAPIQGSAADIIKIAMIRIHDRFMEEDMKSRMILQVHDELNFDVWKPELEKVQKIVVKEMEGAVKLSVPLVVDYGTGSNWLEAH
jgi:DNA polymerase-1